MYVCIFVCLCVQHSCSIYTCIRTCIDTHAHTQKNRHRKDGQKIQENKHK